MNHSDWPQTSDLVKLLRGAGILTSSPPTDDAALVDYAGALDEARIAFEDETGRRPFKATTATVYADPPGPNRRTSRYPSLIGGGRILRLDQPLAALTSLKVGHTSTYAGTLLTEGLDYWLRPENDLTQRPHERVEFRAVQWGPPRSIEIVGVWGWAATVALSVVTPIIPEDAWSCVLRHAAVLVLPSLASQVSGGVKSVTLGPDKFDFGAGGAYDSTGSQWGAAGQKTIDRYLRYDL